MNNLACQRHHPAGRPQPVSRRAFLKMLGGSAAGVVLGTTTNTLGKPQVYRPRVSIAEATDYEPQLIRRKLQELLDNLGGLRDVVGFGDRVAIKVNLTGGTKIKPLAGAAPIESYVTHPQVVQALCELLRDAGASRLYIVEGIFDGRSYMDWGYEAFARPMNATLVNLNSPEPYADFAQTSVGQRWFVYRDFSLNHLLEEVDTFISVAKMKCHWWAGVTLSMKNLVGIAPVNAYNSSPLDTNRSSFHGTSDLTGLRLPRVILDLNQARPIDLAIIDGIKTVEGGEGPWVDATQVDPGVLIAGKNAVSTDAVAMAVMGFDPTADMPSAPFLRGLNHLNMAHEVGLGTNRLDEIEVVGATIDDVKRPFRPCNPTALF